MLRASLKIAACLLLGVLATVMVAWGCVLAAGGMPLRAGGFESENETVMALLARDLGPGGTYCDQGRNESSGLESISVLFCPNPNGRPGRWRWIGDVEGDWLERNWSFAGWPWMALSNQTKEFQAQSAPSAPGGKSAITRGLVIKKERVGAWPAEDVALPLRPEWRGLAYDAALYASFALVVWPLRAEARRWLRKFRHQCVACGYDLTGNTSGVCPECGKPVTPRAEATA